MAALYFAFVEHCQFFFFFTAEHVTSHSTHHE